MSGTPKPKGGATDTRAGNQAAESLKGKSGQSEQDSDDLPDLEKEQAELLNEIHGASVWNILVSGYHFWSSNDIGAYLSEELECTSRLLYSSFFEPDDWFCNSDELDPILGEAHKKRRRSEAYRGCTDHSKAA